MTEHRTAGDALAAKKRELLRLRLAEEGLLRPAAEAADRIPAREEGVDPPLSATQRRMWFLQQLDPASPAYNLCGGAELRGRLDVGALRRALAEVVSRHEVLRTTYRVPDGGLPVQVVREEAELPLEVLDLSGLPERDRAEEVEAVTRAEGRRPFDLAEDLPLRVLLVRLADDEHLLVLTAHHIAFDDVSWRPLITELAAGYAASATGRPVDAPPRPALQYGDFAAWQRDFLAGDRLDAQRRFWRDRLDPAPPALDLPTDSARPPTPALDGGRRSVTLPAEVWSEITELGRGEGATPFMVVLAAFQALLFRYTGSTDIAVGSPVINRDRPELEDLIGNFGNTLVLRTDLSGDPTFRGLLRRVREVCAESFAHQDLPFDTMVEELKPARAINRSALFDVVFSQRVEAPRDVELPGLVLRERELYNGVTRFDLVLGTRPETAPDGAPAGLTCTLTYRLDLFTAETADRLLGHLRELLGSALADPDLPVGRLRLMSGPERTRVVEEWNRTDADFPLDRPLHRLLEDRAAAAPDDVAVVAYLPGGGTEQVTRAGLNASANRLARYLVSLGVTAESLVGVHLERSVDLVVALLAVLKAGGTFVPLETSWPAARVRTIAEDAGLSLVVSRSAPADPAEAPDLPVVRLDLVGEALAGFGDTDLVAGVDCPDVGGESCAYVIYTSGSTGTPKGAMIRHRGLANRLPWQRGLLGLGRDDAVLFKAPLSFDISMNEVFLPLYAGARLVVAEPGGHADVGHLLEVVAEQRVTFVYLVASMLDLVLERPDVAEATRSLRHVWCGGETVSPELHRRFRERIGVTMYHGYGPAETTIGVTCQVYAEDDDPRGISIGRPNPNTAIHLLDDRLAPVPVGVTGEIYVGGEPLGRGYLNQPGLTASRFVANPFGSGDRLYRTGDLGRYRPDGSIVFLGRTDNQVKIRGSRVELEEIEAVLRRHPDVRQAVVLLREDTPGAAALAAYYVHEEGRALPAADLRGWLARQVPDYMVPTAFTALPAFPALDSGKVDRAALRALAPRAAAGEPAVPHLEPRAATERLVAAVWSEVLGAPAVGLDDNFFDLGGHSLLLVRVQTRLRAELGRDLPVVELYTHPTVRALAAHLDATRAAGDEDGSARAGGGNGSARADDGLDKARERAARQRLAMTAGRVAQATRRAGDDRR
ncbi:amino acid adenylation domain-containing protein [Saccharothrix xinjiangensis]|uniref:Amino acid adenylation domain-containing protein n=1 Tax=Saccharothrix xinjiangensis TaxID=204798 RepID=A0ABV9Y5Z7_9PSEU